MKSSLIKSMLAKWEEQAVEARDLVTTEIELDRHDLRKVEALAEAYGLESRELLADLISTALQEVEEQIPYVPGERVIRVEEGDPVYEDVGRTPAYLAALSKREQSHN